MDNNNYLDKFNTALNLLEREKFSNQQLELKVGFWMNSVVLKIQKDTWRNKTAEPFKSSIFFSIWISDALIKQNKLAYNIHTLKLRELSGYTIKSREFAEAFRQRFKAFENSWPNVGVNFGPLTLMEGWVSIDNDNIENDIADLANQFLAIAYIIDDLLAERKK
jgi:hypothetical protein